MSKIPSSTLQIWSLARCLWRLYFFCSRGSCILFFRFRFWWFGLNTNLAYVSKLGEEGVVVCSYLFMSQRQSHSFPDRAFLAPLLHISPHFELSRIELPKLTSSILMEIVTIVVVLVDQFYFLHAPSAHKAQAFRKNYLMSKYLCISIWF